MRHYEIIVLVHPDQSEQVPGMIERYSHLVKEHKGVVHRVEDWGRRALTYTIRKVKKAHYLCFNVECDEATRTELENSFRFNDAIIRNLITRVERAETEPSVMMKSNKRHAEVE